MNQTQRQSQKTKGAKDKVDNNSNSGILPELDHGREDKKYGERREDQIQSHRKMPDRP